MTREELQQRLWPGATCGDFEHGLNAAVNRLRETLGDSATDPNYIETVPRRGYRFIARVDQAPNTTTRMCPINVVELHCQHAANMGSDLAQSADELATDSSRQSATLTQPRNVAAHAHSGRGHRTVRCHWVYGVVDEAQREGSLGEACTRCPKSSGWRMQIGLTTLTAWRSRCSLSSLTIRSSQSR